MHHFDCDTKVGIATTTKATKKRFSLFAFATASLLLVAGSPAVADCDLQIDAYVNFHDSDLQWVSSHTSCGLVCDYNLDPCNQEIDPGDTSGHVGYSWISNALGAQPSSGSCSSWVFSVSPCINQGGCPDPASSADNRDTVVVNDEVKRGGDACRFWALSKPEMGAWDSLDMMFLRGKQARYPIEEREGRETAMVSPGGQYVSDHVLLSPLASASLWLDPADADLRAKHLEALRSWGVCVDDGGAYLNQAYWAEPTTRWFRALVPCALERDGYNLLMHGIGHASGNEASLVKRLQDYADDQGLELACLGVADANDRRRQRAQPFR